MEVTVETLLGIMPLLFLGLTCLGLTLYALIGERSVLVGVVMPATLVMFAAFVVYFVWR
jgi:hypothetical protein